MPGIILDEINVKNHRKLVLNNTVFKNLRNKKFVLKNSKFIGHFDRNNTVWLLVTRRTSFYNFTLNFISGGKWKILSSTIIYINNIHIRRNSEI